MPGTSDNSIMTSQGTLDAYAEPDFPLISQESNILSIRLLSFKALLSKTETTVLLNCFSSTGDITTSSV
jgi:hypothetical protein